MSPPFLLRNLLLGPIGSSYSDGRSQDMGLPTTSYPRPFVVMCKTGAGSFSESEILDNASKDSYRGGTAFDFNNDGKTDMVILAIDGRRSYLKTTQKRVTTRWACICAGLRRAARHRCVRPRAT